MACSAQSAILFPVMTTDVLIIGSGIAGLNFALCAAENHDVTIVTKKEAVDSNTNHAQGGIAAVLDAADKTDKHIQDTLTAGCFHNDKKAVRFMVEHGPRAIQKLLTYGVGFATDDQGKLLLTREGGHCARRIAFVGDYTGQEIEAALIKKVRANPRIRVLEHTMALDLIMDKNQCLGATVLWANHTEEIWSRMTVLATGGLGRIYAHTTNPEISTGDGIAMAVRASSKIKFKDLEFVQFHPTALNIPGKPQFLLSEALRGEGAFLRNHKEKRFLAELAPRDIVARAIYEEEKKGPVYLDMRHLKGHKLAVRFPKIAQKLAEYGLDLEKNLIPISPAAHYSCGGIKVNLHGETGVKGLCAFGEVACTGVHGANRLASNSLLEALVFSEQILKKLPTMPPHRIVRKKPSPITSESTALRKKCALLQNEIQKIMWEYVGIMRTQKGLQKAITALTQLEKKIPKGMNRSIITTHNMLTTGKEVARAALARKKSIGAHMVSVHAAESRLA